MPDVPGSDLARPRCEPSGPAGRDIAEIDRLSLEGQVACELAGIQKSFKYASEVLGI